MPTLSWLVTVSSERVKINQNNPCVLNVRRLCCVQPVPHTAHVNRVMYLRPVRCISDSVSGEETPAFHLCTLCSVVHSSWDRDSTQLGDPCPTRYSQTVNYFCSSHNYKAKCRLFQPTCTHLADIAVRVGLCRVSIRSHFEGREDELKSNTV